LDRLAVVPRANDGAFVPSMMSLSHDILLTLLLTLVSGIGIDFKSTVVWSSDSDSLGVFEFWRGTFVCGLDKIRLSSFLIDVGGAGSTTLLLLRDPQRIPSD
jgi:hypothetical protein